MITRVLTAIGGIAVALLCFAGTSSALPAGSSPTGITWTDNAKDLRGQNGSQFLYVCPAGGSLGSLWGTDVYTDDSSVCTAAVHAGKITRAHGGTVTIRIQAGLPSYSGSARNGVTSSSYGAWGGSYVLVGATQDGGSAAVRMGQAGWTATAVSYRGQNGARFAWICPAGGSAEDGLGSGHLHRRQLRLHRSGACREAHAGPRRQGHDRDARGSLVLRRLDQARESRAGRTAAGAAVTSS